MTGTSVDQRADGLTTAEREKIAKLWQKVPGDWKPCVQWLGASIGSKWDGIRGPLYIRLISYAKDGFTLDDVKEACRTLCTPDVQERCTWPDDWLKEFAAAIRFARSVRENRERRERKAALYARPTAEERAKVAAAMDKWREDNGLPPLDRTKPRRPVVEELFGDQFGSMPPAESE